MFNFEYALQFRNGLYYTGRVNSEAEPNAWQGEAHQAFCYTENGAYIKKAMQECFAECTVVHLF